MAKDYYSSFGNLGGTHIFGPQVGELSNYGTNFESGYDFSPSFKENLPQKKELYSILRKTIEQKVPTERLEIEAAENEGMPSAETKIK